MKMVSILQSEQSIHSSSSIKPYQSHPYIQNYPITKSSNLIKDQIWRSLIGKLALPTSQICKFIKGKQSIMKHYFDNPNQLLEEIWEDKDVNIVERQNSIDRSKYCLIDFSLNSSGQEEDKKYALSRFYRENIRRGNTLIEYLHNSKYQQMIEDRRIEIARKGTPKIMDIKLQHIRYFRHNQALAEKEKAVAQIIFQEVNRSLKEGKRVQLIKTEKANGENAQVSYDRIHDAWVICSKNVSLLARHSKDLNRFKQIRYKFATLIGDQWFKQISHLDQNQIHEIKKLLTGFTIVGQYCGNPQYQHLVRYEEIGIKWFAMVDNYSDEYCVDPFKTKKLLEKFKLKTVKIKNIVITSNPENFYETLEKLYLKTAQAGLQNEEYGMQGSIVYFAVQQMKEKTAQAITIGAGKLKTLEYRYFRKIREKMSRYIKRREQKNKLVGEYLKQIQQLQNCNQSKTVFPQKYYVKILEAGLNLVDAVKLHDEELRGNFITILKIIFYALYKKIDIMKHGRNLLNDVQFKEKISEILFTKYGGLGCSSKIIYLVLGLPGMFKSYLAKSMAPHFEKICTHYEILSCENPQNLQTSLTKICSPNQKESSLQHYFLDGTFQSNTIMNIISQTKKNGNKDCYYKFVLIHDQLKQSQSFSSDEYNDYPFRLETIIMCYLGQHQHKMNSPTIQAKIDNLAIVTEKLKATANFGSSLKKLEVTLYPYPFSFKSKIENLNEFQPIIRTLLVSQDEKVSYNQYCLLIIRLEKIKGVEYLDEQTTQKEVKHLIQSSYPSIPTMCFKGIQNS